MKLSIATMALLAQMALCDSVLQAREAKVTAAATLLDRRAQEDDCNAGKTACGDGNGCCPRGSKCTTAKGGVGMCAGACDGATLFCEFVKGVKLCCQPGAGCDYSQSVCTQHSTDSGGVWTATSTSSTSTESGTKLPTTPVFSSTSDGGDSSSSSTTDTDAGTATTTTESSAGSSAEGTSQSSQSSTEPAGSSAATDSGTAGGATPTKNPKDSGSAVVVSWSAGVLAAVFGIMVAL